MKSGYHMTFNDQVHVQAQWPQLNVYRAANSIATYGCLSVKEFCTGYLTYMEDSLKGSKPKIDVALDYLSYLHELLDEVPLLGWEVVRDAHGEILRLVEQCRLKWEDVNARGKAISKALRRAKLQALERAMSGQAESKPVKISIEKKPCVEYQKNECPEKSSHKEENVVWLHCCATCYRVKNKSIPTQKLSITDKKL